MRTLALLAVLLAPLVASADGGALVGTWKLESFVQEALPSGERTKQFGDHPDGYLTYTADGRMQAILVTDNRIKPRDVVPTDAERAKLHASMVAYAGSYTVDKDKVVHHVDMSWNQAWTGTDQVRFFKIDGDTLTITTAPDRSPIDGKQARFMLIWRKVKPARSAR